MVAGISLLLEPSGEHADVHRQIVDRFLEDHKETLPDGYSREEGDCGSSTSLSLLTRKVANLKKHDRGRLAESGRAINGEASRRVLKTMVLWCQRQTCMSGRRPT
jgi:hypothetical protein